MIRLGIVGCNYGSAVLLPAFRLDTRCQVVGLAGSSPARAREVAQKTGIETVFDGWRQLVASPDIDAVAIATPPMAQPDIALAALAAGKAVFAEKPMAGDLVRAKAMLQAARGRTTMMDFGFTEIPAWRRAKGIIEERQLGRLRHVAVTWHVENAATRLRQRGWKSDLAAGGGALGNLASHSLHCLEWFCGPVAGLSARLSGLPDDPEFQTTVALNVAFVSGASGSYSMSCAAFGGSGHRLEFYGEEGALILDNPTPDYMRGFKLRLKRRSIGAAEDIAVDDDAVDRNYPEEARIAPVSRLARRFVDAIESGKAATPDFTDGYRVQVLMDAVRRSHDSGRWVDVTEAGK